MWGKMPTGIMEIRKTQTDIENVLSALTEFSKNTGKGHSYQNTIKEPYKNDHGKNATALSVKKSA